MKIRCSNEECDTRNANGAYSLFTLKALVGVNAHGETEFCEVLDSVEPGALECWFCEAKAEEVKLNEDDMNRKVQLALKDTLTPVEIQELHEINMRLEASS